MKKQKFMKKCLVAGILLTMALAPVITDGESIADTGITAQTAGIQRRKFMLVPLVTRS